LFSELLEETLNRGHSIRFRAPGDSMYPTIRDGDVITVTPLGASSVTIGDIILYQHKAGVTVHRVMRILKRNEEASRSALKGSQDRSFSETLHFFLRGDAAVVFDDPVSADQILGKVTLVEREGRRIDPYSFRAKIRFKARRLAACFRRFVFIQTN
jgi:signal peptidase I